MHGDARTDLAAGNSRDPNARLQWESIDNSIYQLDDKTLLVGAASDQDVRPVLTFAKPLPPPVEGDASLPYEISNLRNYSLAVSGDVFRWVVDFAPPEVLRRVRSFPEVPRIASAKL